YEVSSLAFEFSGKDTTLLGHLTPRYGEHSRLNECPVSLDHYRVTFQGTTLYWAYISDASTTFAYRVFGDGPVDGTLFYGVC
ncbi:hypothetical protein, partial [Pseudomonas lundensis]|uniref:hypothetical protein n=1 Tax=Pseudomonas lundensis TaxID=86185 RepID=UPI001CA408EF